MSDLLPWWHHKRLRMRWYMWRTSQLGRFGRLFWGATFWWVYRDIGDPFYRSWNPRRAIRNALGNKDHEIFCMKAPHDEFVKMRDECIRLEYENKRLKLDNSLLSLSRNTEEQVRGMFGLYRKESSD